MATGKVLMSMKDKPPFVKKYCSIAYTSLAAGGSKTYTATNLGYSVPEGYTPFAVYRFGAGSAHCSVTSCNPFNPDRMLSIRNSYHTSQSSTAGIGITFVRSDLASSIGILNLSGSLVSNGGDEGDA